MEVNILHDKALIYSYLLKNPELQIYCIGDLDDFFWPKTIWYALTHYDKILAMALLYTGMEIPTLLSFYKDNDGFNQNLLENIKTLLPKKFYAHLSPGLTSVFGKENIIEYYGLNNKMSLKNCPENIEDENIRNLSVSELTLISELYRLAYPHNWFDKRMLETGKYFGYFIENDLVGISGIHVYSSKYKVAALGNIAVHPDYRGKQIAYKLTVRLCNDLKKSVDFIGLNVKSDNDFAIRCYENAGFEIIARYEECFIYNS